MAKMCLSHRFAVRFLEIQVLLSVPSGTMKESWASGHVRIERAI